MGRRRLYSAFGLSVAAAGASLALAAGSLPAQAASQLPLANEATQFELSLSPALYNASPAGANVSCTPSAAHPFPVVLVEGTFASQFNSFGAVVPGPEEQRVLRLLL